MLVLAALERLSHRPPWPLPRSPADQGRLDRARPGRDHHALLLCVEDRIAPSGRALGGLDALVARADEMPRSSMIGPIDRAGPESFLAAPDALQPRASPW
jgi:hypothetical protein